MNDHLLAVINRFARLYPKQAEEIMALDNSLVSLKKNVIYPIIDADNCIHIGYLPASTMVKIALINSPFTLHPFTTITLPYVRLSLADVGILLPAPVTMTTLQVMEVQYV